MVAPVGLGFLPKTDVLLTGGCRQSTAMGGRKAEFLDFDQDSGTPGKEKLNTFLLVRKNDEQHLRGEVKAEAPVQNELLQKSKPSIGRITPSPCMKAWACQLPD